MDNDRVSQHREALGLLDDLVASVTEDDLARPTPCAAWTLGDLLAHQVGQHRGFAAAVGDGDAPESAYEPVPFTAEAWRGSCDAVLAAFASADPESEVVERELAPTPLPLAAVLGAQLIDTVVHTWDVARSLEGEFVPPADLDQAVAAIADGLPPTASGPGAAFAEALGSNGSGTRWEQTLRRVGRDPGWGS